MYTNLSGSDVVIRVLNMLTRTTVGKTKCTLTNPDGRSPTRDIGTKGQILEVTVVAKKWSGNDVKEINVSPDKS